MKNVLKVSASGQDLLYSVNDGTNTLFINGTEIASSNWVGTGNYTTTAGGHTLTIAKVSSASGNLMLAETETAYTYEFRRHDNGGDVQYAFGNFVVGSNACVADRGADTLTLIAGNKISLSADASSDEISITAEDPDALTAAEINAICV